MKQTKQNKTPHTNPTQKEKKEQHAVRTILAHTLPTSSASCPCDTTLPENKRDTTRHARSISSILPRYTPIEYTKATTVPLMIHPWFSFFFFYQ
jgi:hypothetical protein